MKKGITGFWKIFKHNIIYKDGYGKRFIITILTLLVIDLVVLYIIW